MSTGTYTIINELQTTQDCSDILILLLENFLTATFWILRVRLQRGWTQKRV